MGGVWAQLDLRFEYDEESGGKNPFWIEKLTPIQIATFDLEEYRRVRSEFTTDEWLDLIIRSMGYEPGDMSRRLKLLFLVRLFRSQNGTTTLSSLGRAARARATSFRRSRHTRRCSRRHDGSKPFRAHLGPSEGHGPDLGRRRLRRGR